MGIKLLLKVKERFSGLVRDLRDLVFNPERLIGKWLSDDIENIFFIEIGASDGKSDDPIYKYVVAHGWRGILVEPVKYIFERLVNNYKDAGKNLIFENVAIAEKNEVRYIYRYKENQRDLPEWYQGTASLLKNLESRHKGIISNINERLVSDKVNCITFEDLIKKHRVKKIDLLLIDTEGYDFNIIRTINFDTVKPRIIIYETRLLSPEDNTKCEIFLRSKGYRILACRFDNFAFIDSRAKEAKAHIDFYLCICVIKLLFAKLKKLF